MATIRDRLDVIRQREFITVSEFALLVGVSERTVWRRLPELPHVIRSGRITRIHRLTAVRHFLRKSA